MTQSNALKSDTPLAILIVDDDFIYPEILKMHARDLTMNRPIIIEHANSSDECLTKTSEQHYDLIVMDIDLGKGSLDGIETIAMLRNRHVSVPICIHSHYVGSNLIDTGANCSYAKPMNFANFSELLDTTVNNKPPTQ